MINTVEIKRDKAKIYTVGNLVNPKEVILIVGSCRCVAYINYLNRYNESAGQPFRIHFIDPHDWHWDEVGNLVDIRDALEARETDPRNLEVIRSTTIFLHEHYANFGMFNTDRGQEKNIYQFGMQPHTDICFPNFHNHFILCQEQVQFDADTRAMVENEGRQPTLATVQKMRDFGNVSLERFYGVCAKSSFPEFAEHFRTSWRHVRYFWTGNHIAAPFTLYLFRQLNDRFLKLPLTGAFWDEAVKEDLFANPHTPVTKYDIQTYDLKWNCPIAELTI